MPLQVCGHSFESSLQTCTKSSLATYHRVIAGDSGAIKSYRTTMEFVVFHYKLNKKLVPIIVMIGPCFKFVGWGKVDLSFSKRLKGSLRLNFL
jgi:hypothetical protein